MQLDSILTGTDEEDVVVEQTARKSDEEDAVDDNEQPHGLADMLEGLSALPGKKRKQPSASFVGIERRSAGHMTYMREVRAKNLEAAAKDFC